LATKCPNFFFSKERIIRFVYSEQNINPRKGTLKSNFVGFQLNPENGRFELSCIRFEFDKLIRFRILGRAYENPQQKRAYYGIGCTSVELIRQDAVLTLAFTPKFDQSPPIPYHVDIYDNTPPMADGRANTAEMNLRRDTFKEAWRVYEDSDNLIKDRMAPPI
jgi:hypothetical protein